MYRLIHEDLLLILMSLSPLKYLCWFCCQYFRCVLSAFLLSEMLKVKVSGAVFLLSFCAEEDCLLAFRAAELSGGWDGGRVGGREELYPSG